MKISPSLAATVGIALAALGACRGSVDRPANCAEDPLACPAGQTCWPTDAVGGFACLAAKDYKKAGDDCELVPQRAGCAAGLICLGRPGGDAGFVINYCAPFCDPKRAACGAGERCVEVTLFEGATRSVVRACARSADDGGAAQDLSTPPDLVAPPPADMARTPRDLSMMVEDMTEAPPDMATPEVDMAAEDM